MGKYVSPGRAADGAAPFSPGAPAERGGCAVVPEHARVFLEVYT